MNTSEKAREILARYVLLAWRQGLARAWDEAVPARLRKAMPGLFAPALWGRARFPDGKVRRVVTQPAADPDTYMNGGRDEFLRANEPRLPAFLASDSVLSVRALDLRPTGRWSAPKPR